MAPATSSSPALKPMKPLKHPLPQIGGPRKSEGARPRSQTEGSNASNWQTDDETTDCKFLSSTSAGSSASSDAEQAAEAQGNRPATEA
ncbi:unnamed protein product, partial [Polarella glacialis]